MPHANGPSGRSSSRRAIVRALAGGAIGSAFLAAGWNVNAAVPRGAMELMSAPVPRLPTKLVIVYGHPHDAAAFETYFAARHLPLARALPFCASIEIALAVAGPAGEAPAFYRMATLTFASEADMAACVASEAGQLALADIATFATGGATATVITGIEAYQGGETLANAADATGPE